MKSISRRREERWFPEADMAEGGGATALKEFSLSLSLNRFFKKGKGEKEIWSNPSATESDEKRREKKKQQL